MKLNSSDLLKFHQAILNNAPLMIISTDTEGIITSFNPLAEQLLGYSAEEVIGKFSPALFHDLQEIIDYAPLLSAELQEVIPIGFEIFVAKSKRALPNAKEWTYIAKNGYRFPIDLAINAMKDEKGHIIGYLGIAKDITEQKKADRLIKKQNELLKAHEEELKQQLEEMTSLQEEVNQNLEELNAIQEELEKQKNYTESIIRALDASTIVSITDTSGKILKANSKFCEVSQYTEEELLGQDHRIVNSGFHSKDFWRKMWQTIAQGRTWRAEVKNKAKDGSEYWVDSIVNPIVDKEGKIIQFLSIRNLITKRKLAEADVKRLSLVASKTVNAVIITDANGAIQWVNNSFTHISGYTLEEALGKKPGRLLQGKDTDPADIQKIREGIQSRQSFTHEILNYHKNGRAYWLLLNITPIFDEDGTIEQFMAIEMDVTERKQIEKEMQAKNEALLASEEELKQNLEELHATQEELHLHNKQLSLRNKNISDSINYAKRIQQALLPPLAQIQTAFPESFVLYMPRDVISGDFYWFAEKGSLQIMVAADCTGHGVPGAFMSMLGSSLLSQIVHDKEIHSPANILDMWHLGVEEMLNQRQENSQSRDGMDASICVVNRQKQEVQFAGANNPVYIISEKPIDFMTEPPQELGILAEPNQWQLTEIKGDKKSIGGRLFHQTDAKYRLHRFRLDQPMAVYLFSDGYMDQIGAESKRKLKSQNFKQLIYDQRSEKFADQRENLYSFFRKWMGETERQMDDVLVLGFRL
jgi:PAS domain S-box-containing protein